MTDTAQTTTPARLLIIGPQGSGKGTQAARITELLSIPAISTGDLFRAHVKNETDLGKQVKAVLDRGELVTDDMTFSLVRDRLNEGDTGNGFLLDGFPRNAAQVTLLDEFLTPRQEELTAVIELGVPREVSIDRLFQRAQEQGRTDDTEEVISKRLEIYEKETAPILDVYRSRGLVDTVDGVGSLEEVTARIVGALSTRGIAAS